MSGKYRLTKSSRVDILILGLVRGLETSGALSTARSPLVESVTESDIVVDLGALSAADSPFFAFIGVEEIRESPCLWIT